MKHSSLSDVDTWAAREFKPAPGPTAPVVRLPEPDARPPWSLNKRDKKNDLIRTERRYPIGTAARVIAL